jgi:hypothetical protein
MEKKHVLASYQLYEDKREGSVRCIFRTVLFTQSPLSFGDEDEEDKCKGILHTIEKEEQKSIWRQINRAIDTPLHGTMPFVQRMEQGEVVDIYETEAMNLEIQVMTEQRFDLSMSAPITMTLLCDRLGILSDSEFAMQMLRGEVHIPPDVDTTNTLVLKEIYEMGGKAPQFPQPQWGLGGGGGIYIRLVNLKGHIDFLAGRL